MNNIQVVVKQEIGKISFNYDEIKQLVTDETKRYSGLVLTEGDVAPAKKDRAELNHKFDDLDTRRKEIKKSYMQPFDEFETKVKEIGKIITDASETIDKQIKVFEDAERQKKKDEISQFYNSVIGEIGNYLSFDRIYDTKWENKAVSMKSIKESIESLISSTVLAINTIKAINSEAVDKALEQYQKDLSLTNAIAYINRYEAQKAEILAKEEARRKAEEEAKAEQEKESIRKEERQKIADEERIRNDERSKSAPAPIIKPEPILAKDDFEDEPFASERPFVPGKQWIIYEILCSDADKKTIEAQLEMFGIKYRRA